MESLDAYYAFTDDSGTIVAGAGIAGDVLKCLAVSEEARSEGLLVPLVSRILSEHPAQNLKVFTKPEYQAVFESLGFHLLARAPLAILLENGRGLEQYCTYLRSFAREGRCGVVVMNANPFTLGHKYLLQQAASQVDHLFVIPVKEDLSHFPYAERLAMIKAGAPGDVTVLDGSDYVISAATFPTYFLKDLSDASVTQMYLDTDLYGRWIAPALGASVRFVGSEPFDALTNHYNRLIPNAVIIPRLDNISASSVRSALAAGHYREAAALCPDTTWPYLLAALVERALRLELDTPGKPGLVGPDGPGAHKDMDYNTMLSGIKALRPFWARMALAGSAEELRQLGIDAEAAMTAATGGVNTHRGAIFCMGLALYAVSRAFARDVEVPVNEHDMKIFLGEIAQVLFCIQLKDSNLRITPSARGARQIALSGYKMLFEDWLPYYRKCSAEGPVGFSGASAQNIAAEGPVGFSGASAQKSATEKPTPSAELKLLLRIMSTLDDTCVVKRVGEERAQEVKREAKEGKDLYKRYAAEGISPGGAADMLALTIFIDSIIS